jgi:lysophospholipase L1-like esterase
LKNPVDGAYKNFKYPDFIGIPFNPNTDEYPYPMKSINVTYDGLHPSDKGYKKIASSLIDIFKKLN